MLVCILIAQIPQPTANWMCSSWTNYFKNRIIKVIHRNVFDSQNATKHYMHTLAKHVIFEMRLLLHWTWDGAPRGKSAWNCITFVHLEEAQQLSEQATRKRWRVACIGESPFQSGHGDGQLGNRLLLIEMVMIFTQSAHVRGQTDRKCLIVSSCPSW